jgi:hypothetical protein
LNHNLWATPVALVDHQPLRRLITPIGFGDKAFKSKRYTVLDQTFFEKVCGQTFSEKGCDHAASKVLDQTVSQKVCG